MCFTSCGLISALLLLCAGSAAAGTTIFRETFDSGSAVFTSDPYWADTSLCNGIVLQTTFGAFCGGGFGPAISTDASGSGFFLMEGTAAPSGPTSEDRFYISPVFALTPQTAYTISFYLTNADDSRVPSVQAEIGQTLLGAPVTALGTFAGNGWQQFTFTWNSGANTSASLTLHDLVAGSNGNDFGLDNIVVASAAPDVVPEPGTGGNAVLGGIGLVAAVFLRRHSHQTARLPN